MQEQAQGHVTMPALPAAALTVAQAKELPTVAEALLDRPAQAGQPHQPLRGHLRGAIEQMALELVRDGAATQQQPDVGARFGTAAGRHAMTLTVSRADIASVRELLSDEPRKSVERMVLRLRGADANAARTQQLFLRKARWDDAPILAAPRELVAATLGKEEGVLAIDGTDIPKDGVESVGVARQYCGQPAGGPTARPRSSRPTWGAGPRPRWTGVCT